MKADRKSRAGVHITLVSGPWEIQSRAPRLAQLNTALEGFGTEHLTSRGVQPPARPHPCDQSKVWLGSNMSAGAGKDKAQEPAE